MNIIITGAAGALGSAVIDRFGSAGDRLALHSDGLRHIDLDATRDLPLERACERLMQAHATTADDASILLTDFHDA